MASILKKKIKHQDKNEEEKVQDKSISYIYILYIYKIILKF